MKRLLPLLLAALLLLSACGRNNAEPQPYKILGQARLEDCTLSIHYDDGHILRRRLLFLDELLDEETAFTHHTVVSGTELMENELFLALLEKLDPAELPPEQDLTNYSGRISPTVYYVLRDRDGKKLFDVGLGGDNVNPETSQAESIDFNGEKIPYDALFFSCVEPYLTEPYKSP